jgi:hypothetical protein
MTANYTPDPSEHFQFGNADLRSLTGEKKVERVTSEQFAGANVGF